MRENTGTSNKIKQTQLEYEKTKRLGKEGGREEVGNELSPVAEAKVIINRVPRKHKDKTNNKAHKLTKMSKKCFLFLCPPESPPFRLEKWGSLCFPRPSALNALACYCSLLSHPTQPKHSIAINNSNAKPYYDQIPSQCIPCLFSRLRRDARPSSDGKQWPPGHA